MRVGYLGPEGTFSHEAVLAAAPAGELELISLPSIYDAVMAVRDGTVERALVPIENSLEGSVNATLDSLTLDTDEVAIVGELVLAIHQCLIARVPVELDAIEVVVSHPQPIGQCARFLRRELPAARVMTVPSTAEAVRMLAEHDGAWAALGNELAAERYGCVVLRAGVEDGTGNATRFVWLGRAGSPPGAPGLPAAESGPWKTAIVFWGAGSEAPGWLVSCLSELSSRGVNMTRIESRPRKQGLGRYMFFVDVEGRDREGPVRDGLAALRGHVEALRVLGSFPAWPEG